MDFTSENTDLGNAPGEIVRSIKKAHILLLLVCSGKFEDCR